MDLINRPCNESETSVFVDALDEVELFSCGFGVLVAFDFDREESPARKHSQDVRNALLRCSSSESTPSGVKRSLRLVGPSKDSHELDVSEDLFLNVTLFGSSGGGHRWKPRSRVCSRCC